MNEGSGRMGLLGANGEVHDTDTFGRTISLRTVPRTTGYRSVSGRTVESTYNRPQISESHLLTTVRTVRPNVFGPSFLDLVSDTPAFVYGRHRRHYRHQ